MGVVRTISKSIREYKGYAIANPFFMVGEVACECTIPFVIGELINVLQTTEIGGTNELLEIAKYGGILLALAVASLIFGFLGGKIAAIASTGFAKNLRHDLFAKIQSFSFSNIDKFSTSSLVTRMTTDINYVQQAFQMIIRIAFRVPLMMIFAVVMAFSINHKLSWIFVCLIPLLGTILILVVTRAFKLFTVVFKKYDNLNASIQENVKGIRVVKTYVREDYEKAKFAVASNDLKDRFTKAERLVALTNPSMQGTMYIAYILIGIFGAYAIVATNNGDFTYGPLKTGNLSSLITYGIQILSSLMMLSMILVMIVMSAASARRICEVLNEKPSLHNPPEPVYEIKDGSIDFNDVSFKYSANAEKYALSNINLHIKSGMTVGIIGSTGSSKTTLVNLICRLYDTTEGEVKVGGINVKDYDLDTLRNNVAVVLQKNVLFSGTILENLRWGKEDATEEEVIAAAKLAQADSFVQSFPDKYNTYIEQGGTNVSGGQKQRLCIARALLKNPKILILDDSTSAVDTKTDALIRKSFKEYIPSVTKIIITQRASSVEDADVIIVMDNGKINGMGTSEELLKNNAIYREIYTIQNRIGGGK